MLEIDAKVVLFGEVPAVERHICILVGGRDEIWARHVWIHYEIEVMIDEMSEERELASQYVKVNSIVISAEFNKKRRSKNMSSHKP